MKIGFLPLYLKMYDDNSPKLRERLDPFYEKLALEFEKRGIEVIRTPFCRIDSEFRAAVSSYEAAGADAIVTIHMAYSPSLECIGALSETKLPIVVLDTTETYEFDSMQDPKEISYCHGIHGVMDMCSMLSRYEKPYAIAAGHYEKSDCIDRAVGFVKAAASARALSKVKTAILGEAFYGMGDFTIPDEEMKSRFGVEVLRPSAAEMQSYAAAVTDAEIDAKYACDLENYVMCDNFDEAEYRENVRATLALNKMLADKGVRAYTANFSAVTGLPTMPFIGACEAMQNGIGYAGEGDTLTASFVGALLSSYDETNFVEIFCPDWKGDTLFMSHMGEMNYRISDVKPTLQRKGAKPHFTANPYSANARMKGGKGVFVNISRQKEDFLLLASECEMLSFSEDNFPNSMRGWMKTASSTAEFLSDLSRAGATHHSIFVYGATEDEMIFFAELLGMKSVII